MNREHWQRFVRGIATHAITKGQSIEECAARADEIMEAIAAERERCAEIAYQVNREDAEAEFGESTAAICHKISQRILSASQSREKEEKL